MAGPAPLCHMSGTHCAAYTWLCYSLHALSAQLGLSIPCCSRILGCILRCKLMSQNGKGINPSPCPPDQCSRGAPMCFFFRVGLMRITCINQSAHDQPKVWLSVDGLVLMHAQLTCVQIWHVCYTRMHCRNQLPVSMA